MVIKSKISDVFREITISHDRYNELIQTEEELRLVIVMLKNKSIKRDDILVTVGEDVFVEDDESEVKTLADVYPSMNKE